MFPREHERIRFLDWLAWSLQNEDQKPNWAPFLYSDRKGTGKSSLAAVATALFGPANTATQNNVDKLTGRFNMSLLLSKFVVSEEVKL
jgi:phage/plasmid-associated DNA primase